MSPACMHETSSSSGCMRRSEKGQHKLLPCCRRLLLRACIFAGSLMPFALSFAARETAVTVLCLHKPGRPSVLLHFI
jgi:hypothetical protein